MSCGKWLFQYPNDVLVETGSGGGGGIQYALKFGFKEIHSIEINPAHHEICVKMFKNQSNVHLYLGDSIAVLPQILSRIKDKSTFLLDAHVMDVKSIHGEKICPILEELKLILNHGKKMGVRHSILVDDLKFFSGSVEAFDNIRHTDIEKAIKEIDSTYVVRYGKRTISAI